MTYTFKNPEQETIFGYLKAAQTIAVVGLSDKPDRSSYLVAQALQKNGYTIIPVNPAKAGSQILGETVVATLAEIPVHIDIVDVFRRSEFLPEVAREFLATDADVFWAQQGLESEDAERLLRAAGRDKIVMNRCIKVEHAYSGLGHK
ncbi:MAG: CoA-binding protein [Streptococcaceae bacterium]|jgi:predicted CoA-binding protein|nr:CoA-binding protein [Streptococcaceae bacterium]